MKKDIQQLDDFTKGYMACMLWAETDDNEEPLDKNYSFRHISAEAMKRIVADCTKFQADNAELLKKAYELYKVTDGTSPQSYAGHDFWLSRNGHGAGWFDRGFEELGDTLQQKAEECGDCYVYVGDDGKIYLDKA